MKMLETIEAEIEFTAGGNERREADLRLVQGFSQNEKLLKALEEARDEIAALREEVDKLCAPPSTYGVYLSAHEDDTVDVLAQGRKARVRLHPSIRAASLRPGQELLLNDALNVVAAAGYEIQGDVVVLKERLDDERAMVMLRADGEKIGIIADPLRSTAPEAGRPSSDGPEVGVSAGATVQDGRRRSRARRGP
jgi:proteasome-associated ATPase